MRQNGVLRVCIKVLAIVGNWVCFSAVAKCSDAEKKVEFWLLISRGWLLRSKSLKDTWKRVQTAAKEAAKGGEGEEGDATRLLKTMQPVV